MSLDPANYFIIVPNMLGNGLSSSPSNTPPPYDRARFPNVTFYDQVQQQHKLVTEKFGIETLALVTGWSMGAGQTYQWAVSFPDMVERACPFCGSSKTSEHNIVFLEGVKAALTADVAFQGGWYEQKPVKGLRAQPRAGCRAPARLPPASTPAGASRRPSTGTACTPRWATPTSRTSSSRSGRASSSTAAIPTTC
jgi:homoserine O-acetyltransferase